MKKVVLLLLFSYAFIARAQTEAEIRTHYQEINKQIAESIQNGYEGSLYCNEWNTNKNDKSWPAVGIYHETTSFWYDDDPNHISPAERDPKLVLQKVVVIRKSSHLTANEEYLFKNGKLVFFYRQDAEEGNGWETRVYFNAKGMFKSSVKANGKELSAKDFLTEEYKDFKPDPVRLLKDAKKYQDLFVKSMVY